MFKIIQNRKYWFSLSGILVVLSIVFILIWGLKLGIDFTGGSLLEIEFSNTRPSNEEIDTKLSDLELTTLNLQPSNELGLIIRTESVTEEKHQAILNKLNELFIDSDLNENNEEGISDNLEIEGDNIESLTITPVGGDQEVSFDAEVIGTSVGDNLTELRFDSIGPTIGNELKQRALYAIIIVLIAIIFYIAYAFRKISEPVESWKYGLAAIVALAHDIIIITGAYSLLGYLYGFQADALFVTALLTILGFSVHDSIVTFDRVRENLHRHQDETFEVVVNRSVNETIVRSLNTSLTTLFVLLAIYLFGGETIHNFVLTLMLGVIIGTYSSIFVASPLLVVWYKLKKY
ncbi:protein translocase subunit SecF [bacterium]|jgi:preprotein translocase subunit SecF|nr:protein translocase subunit SecF [bacterium]MBT4122072.1 protein translocase subunit SecF [bacterium]MBT4335289.1 protein translocase subunit SecF [bacterium]MBT4495635.1 protein translocase subunit SecF [bacterium]MBT4764111.1 protein translocase subunit SecF [bacterium]